MKTEIEQETQKIWREILNIYRLIGKLKKEMEEQKWKNQKKKKTTKKKRKTN